MASEGIEQKMENLNVEKPSTEEQTPEQIEQAAQQDKEKKDKKKAEKAAEKAAKAAKHAEKGENKQGQGKQGGGKQGGAKQGGGGKKKEEETDTKGITVTKAEDLSEWYQQVILKAEMLEFTDVPGCYIYLPRSYGIWEEIQAFFNEKIKAMGVENSYFPLFISEANLQREKDHVEGFAAEVAWVTEGGKNKLEKKLAVRPTSETAMYSYYSKKIKSHRDLPLKLNQWNNVVRWEFKHAVPFLRSREFLWQEGHTAHMTEAEAGKEVLEILDHYAAIYEDLLAVPVVKGTKTVNEQFPGAHYTTTIEGFIPSVGRGIQAATSHCLGQHFAKMFDITVEDHKQVLKEGETRKKVHVWQNSWGFTTRSIGVMILVHGDDKGAVIPPRVANVQAVLVPVGLNNKTSDEDREHVVNEIDKLAKTLKSAGVRSYLDDREGYSAGFKFNEWEMKGIPLRIEVGPKDLAKESVLAVRRDTGEKLSIAIAELTTEVPKLLERIQKEMLQRASDEFASHRVIVREWKDFVPTLNEKNVLLVQHCAGGECEDEIKKDSAATVEGQEVDARAPSMGAKSLCIPYEQPEDIKEGTKCINPKCGKDAKMWVLFGRSY
jgi:prolyl-tRNA synthetase